MIRIPIDYLDKNIELAKPNFSLLLHCCFKSGVCGTILHKKDPILLSFTLSERRALQYTYINTHKITKEKRATLAKQLLSLSHVFFSPSSSQKHHHNGSDVVTFSFGP